MDVTRRNFLKMTGATALLGGAGVTAFEIFAKGEAPPFPEQSAAAEKKIWAMTIDVNKCLGQGDCTKCFDACHSNHNVPHYDDPKREVKWLWKEQFEHVLPGMEGEFLVEKLKESQILALCNHCDNPPCVRVCPTKATFKREDGIVIMDFHRCIGCRFCMAGCPYGSRSFNWSNPRKVLEAINGDFPTRSMGVVEKCNFCAELLGQQDEDGKQLMPYCVEACPVDALTFGNLDDEHSPLREILRERFAIRRKTALGTGPEVYYLVG
jgi:Fe-S-cluster-containing dehydrogenase component